MSDAEAGFGAPDHVPQVFEAFGTIWEIEVALRLLAGRPPGRLVLDETLAENARFLTSGESTVGRNLLDPVLVVPLPEDVFGDRGGDFVIDGWHRIAQALDEGVHELPAHFLTSADERACRSDDWDSDLAEHLRESHEAWHAIRRSSA
jgi:hypothetical protein